MADESVIYETQARILSLIQEYERAMPPSGASSESDSALRAIAREASATPPQVRSMRPSVPWDELSALGGAGTGAPAGPTKALADAKSSILLDFGLEGGRIIYLGRTGNHFACVFESAVDGRDCRLLFLDGVLSSGEARDGSPILMYAAMMLRGFELVENPSRALVLGVAGGTMVEAIKRAFPGIRVDGVDVDAQVMEIGKKFFSLRQDGRTTLAVEDGRSFVEAKEGAYDMAIMDAFSGISPVPQLSTVEFVRALKRSMRPGGVCMANVIAKVERGGYLQHVFSTYSQVFRKVLALPLCPEGETFNIVIIATDADTGAFENRNLASIYRVEASGDCILSDADNRIRSLSPY